MSVFKGHTLVCPLWKFQILYPPMPSHFQFKDTPPNHSSPYPQNSKKPTVVCYGYFLESPRKTAEDLLNRAQKVDFNLMT